MTDGMPHDDAAERYVLAAAVHSSGRTLAVGALRAEDFHDPRHGALFMALQSRMAGGAPVEPSALLPVVMAIPGLDSGWFVHLLELSVIASSVGYYADLMRDRAIARAIITAGHKAIQIGEEAGDAADLLDAANAACEAIGQAAQRGQAVDDDVAADLEDFLASMEEPDEFTVTPWPDLDSFIGGWAPGQLYVIGARPGQGKSLIGVCAALKAAGRGSRVLFASVEMSKRELYRRMIANVGRIDHDLLVRKRLEEGDWQKAIRAQSIIREMPLNVADNLTRPSEIVARAQALTREHGPLGLLVVDYIQLMREPGSGKTNRQEVVAEFSRTLKLAAKSLHVPVVALAQLNRNAATGEKPRISDLRESGALEQDADVVMLLHRDEEKSPDTLSVAVAKNRHGRGGGFDLYFHGRYQRIDSYAPTRELKAVQ